MFEKLVEYKQTTRLEEKRKKALDQHLSFIVDQTEKYSSWLAESMNKGGIDNSNKTSANCSRVTSPIQKSSGSDGKYICFFAYFYQFEVVLVKFKFTNFCF